MQERWLETEMPLSAAPGSGGSPVRHLDAIGIWSAAIDGQHPISYPKHARVHVNPAILRVPLVGAVRDMSAIRIENREIDRARRRISLMRGDAPALALQSNAALAAS
jgi:hypothetical protein